MVVALAFFLVLFLFVAAFAVDLTRYYSLQRKTQSLADGATLAAAHTLNRVDVLEDLDRSRIVAEARRFVAGRRDYDEDVFEITADLSRGDVQAARFKPRPPDRADTHYRIGLNVKHAFEPYFLPRGIFGDQYLLVQSQAVAEIVPVFSTSNLFDAPEPGPPIPPLRHALYSRLDIKSEDFGNQSCLTVNGSLHADSGYIRFEEMDDPNGCGPGEGSLRINGDLEAGRPLPGGTCAGGPNPGAGCVVFENVNGSIVGDIIYSTDVISSSGPTEEGDRIHADPGQETLVVPPTPDEDPDQYPGAVCTVQGNYTVGGSDDLVGEDGTDCSGGGTFYVRDGSLTVTDFTPEGKYSFVADDSVTLDNFDALGSTELFVYAVDGWIKVQNINQALTINGSFYAPGNGTGGLCNPVQPGCIKFEDAQQNDVMINGSLVSGTLAKFENVRRLTLNHQSNEDVLPDDLRRLKRPNRIADYWKIHLIH